MRILHTSDWHLGKHLEGYSRLDEQELLMDEMVRLADEEKIDMIIVAGDIYDTMNPPSRAETLFYQAVKRLSKDGVRPVVVIAGNHDHPDRLQAAAELAQDHGVLLMGMPNFDLPSGPFGQRQIEALGSGLVRITVGEDQVVLALLPYPSEKRLNQVLTKGLDEEELQRSYSEKIGHLFAEMNTHFTPETINIAVSHLFTMGGETTDSERPIQIGGSLVVEPGALPEDAQYIALGHLHRPQPVKGSNTAYYAGAPLQYSRSEVGYAKSVKVVDLEPGKDAQVRDVYLPNFKPIETWKCDGVDAALAKCEENQDRDVWVYLEIVTDRVLDQEDIRALKRAKKDLLGITPKISGINEAEEDLTEPLEERGIRDLFKDFYTRQYGTEPTGHFMDVFDKLTGEEDENEADTTDTEWLEQLYRGADD